MPPPPPPPLPSSALHSLLLLLQDGSLGSGSMGDESVYQSSPVPQWTTRQTCQWLQALNLEKYTQQFTASNVDGQTLLMLDGAKLKV